MLHTKKQAFTMIELVFVIVVLGILSAVAIPKFAATRTDAQITKGRADIASLRSSIISERQSRLVKGDSSWINRLDNNVASNTEGVVIFDSNETLSATSPQILSYGITTSNSSGHWTKTNANTYAYKVGTTSISFVYYPSNITVSGVFHPAGSFDCDHTVAMCRNLAQ